MSEQEQDTEVKTVELRKEPPELDASILASYNILELIGEGGFGTVYKAEHKKMPGLVALKIVRKDLSRSETAYKRLAQEARAITTLKHENIVSVREFGTGSEGSAYLVMNYIEGESLDAVLKKQRLSVSTTLDIALQVCNGLIHAHEKGILHRDLKPGNIMLVREAGQKPIAKLVDFGIAKIRDEGSDQNITQTGDIVGSPYYMSPEQCQGFPLDERTDVYSLACVIFEMLSTQVPFKGANAIQTIFKHLNDPPPSLKELTPEKELPAGLESVLFKALEKDPANRYQSISAFKNDLELIKNGQAPNGLSPVQQPKKKESRASQGWPAVAVVGMFAVVAIASIFTVSPALIMQTLESETAVGNRAIIPRQPASSQSYSTASSQRGERQWSRSSGQSKYLRRSRQSLP